MNSVAPGCTLGKRDHYVCNRAALQVRLARAKTIGIASSRMDSFAKEQLKKLVSELGKQVAGPEARPDLLFSLQPTNRDGRIEMGPSSVELATFSVSDPRAADGRQGLLWVETYDSPGDQPWASVVVHVLQQFRDSALAH